MVHDVKNLIKELSNQADTKKALLAQRFFKTATGQYGAGDIFLGINVPTLRNIAKKYSGLSLSEIEILLKNKIHEYRLTALLILIIQFKKADIHSRKKIYKIYLKNSKWVNNWDLVDISAPNIVGEWLLKNPREIIYKLSHSKNIWQKRIAVIATFAFIKHGEFVDTFKIAEILLRDSHDLIHKAVGWMLREVGKCDEKSEKEFLDKHCKNMPRTMLRYAIEKFTKKDYQHYLLCSK
jgi:3-methyladenine DNA glycosylase AlkD